jgi:23S rRNA pseudouridine1911/1915/1917 synthase
MIPLLDALALQFPDSAKRTLKQWIEHDRVRVNGQSIASKHTAAYQWAQHLVDPQDKIELTKKQTGPVPILFADKFFIAIDKPSGLLSVPALNEPLSALTLLRQHYKSDDIYAAHRLDEGASGVLLFVRGPHMKETMARLFGAHDLTREYHAIVEGHIPHEEGEWNFPLEELENYHVVISEQGREALTFFKRLHYSAKFTHLHIQLHTGRKHQIRAHTAYVGHPIIGDKRYGSTLNPIKRLGLHAKKLAFTHPVTKKLIDIQSPLPKGFEGLGALL